jgi:hypothetical protein
MKRRQCRPAPARGAFDKSLESETHEGERQERGASMRIRCPPTTKENELPACADELSSINTTK